MNSDVLIFGVRGQDGQLLYSYLRNLGISVRGCSRASGSMFLQDGTKVDCIQVNYSEQSNVESLIASYSPKYIFNFAGNASVGYSFEKPYTSQLSYLTPLFSIVEAIRKLNIDCRLFNASSGDVFGENSCAVVADEFKPRSPYALARSYGTNLCRQYSELYGLFIVNGFLFPHESTLRGKNYFLPKLVNSMKAIKSGDSTSIRLGQVNVVRDFGWAPEYVQGFWKALNYNKPHDYIFSTGIGVSLHEIIKFCLEEFELDDDAVHLNCSEFIRPSEINISIGDPKKTFEIIGWKASLTWKQILKKYIETEA